MNTKHTPGPWDIDAGLDGAVIHNGSGTIAIVPEDLQASSFNARLIAAAPELLEALEGLLGDAGDMGGDLTCVHCGRDYSGSEDVRQSSRCESDDCPANIARAAIAKATGGAR